MEAVKLLGQLADRYQTAMAFHWESLELFEYLGMPGFAKIHNKQFHDETNEALALKLYIIQRYGVTVPDKGPERVNIVEPLTGGKNRMEMDEEQIKYGIQAAWYAYLDWEKKTKAFKEDIAQKLLEANAIEDYQMVSKLVKDNGKELVEVENLILDMAGTGWDMPHIMDMQKQ